MLLPLVICGLSAFGKIEAASFLSLFAASFSFPSDSLLEVVREYPAEHAPAVAYLRAVSADGILARRKDDIDVPSDLSSHVTLKQYCIINPENGDVIGRVTIITAGSSKPVFSLSNDTGHYTAEDLNALTEAVKKGTVVTLPRSNTFEKTIGYYAVSEEVTTVNKRDTFLVSYLKSISKDASVRIARESTRESILMHYIIIDKDDNLCNGLVLEHSGTITFVIATKDKTSCYTQEQLEEYLG